MGTALHSGVLHPSLEDSVYSIASATDIIYQRLPVICQLFCIQNEQSLLEIYIWLQRKALAWALACFPLPGLYFAVGPQNYLFTVVPPHHRRTEL